MVIKFIMVFLVILLLCRKNIIQFTQINKTMFGQ